MESASSAPAQATAAKPDAAPTTDAAEPQAAPSKSPSPPTLALRVVEDDGHEEGRHKRARASDVSGTGLNDGEGEEEDGPASKAPRLQAAANDSEAFATEASRPALVGRLWDDDGTVATSGAADAAATVATPSTAAAPAAEATTWPAAAAEGDGTAEPVAAAAPVAAVAPEGLAAGGSSSSSSASASPLEAPSPAAAAAAEMEAEATPSTAVVPAAATTTWPAATGEGDGTAAPVAAAAPEGLAAGGSSSSSSAIAFPLETPSPAAAAAAETKAEAGIAPPPSASALEAGAIAPPSGLVTALEGERGDEDGAATSHVAHSLSSFGLDTLDTTMDAFALPGTRLPSGASVGSDTSTIAVLAGGESNESSGSGMGSIGAGGNGSEMDVSLPLLAADVLLVSHADTRAAMESLMLSPTRVGHTGGGGGSGQGNGAAAAGEVPSPFVGRTPLPSPLLSPQRLLQSQSSQRSGDNSEGMTTRMGVDVEAAAAATAARGREALMSMEVPAEDEEEGEEGTARESLAQMVPLPLADADGTMGSAISSSGGGGGYDEALSSLGLQQLLSPQRMFAGAATVAVATGAAEYNSGDGGGGAGEVAGGRAVATLEAILTPKVLSPKRWPTSATAGAPTSSSAASSATAPVPVSSEPPLKVSIGPEYQVWVPELCLPPPSYASRERSIDGHNSHAERRRSLLGDGSDLASLAPDGGAAAMAAAAAGSSASSTVASAAAAAAFAQQPLLVWDPALLEERDTHRFCRTAAYGGMQGATTDMEHLLRSCQLAVRRALWRQSYQQGQRWGDRGLPPEVPPETPPLPAPPPSQPAAAYANNDDGRRWVSGGGSGLGSSSDGIGSGFNSGSGCGDSSCSGGKAAFISGNNTAGAAAGAKALSPAGLGSGGEGSEDGVPAAFAAVAAEEQDEELPRPPPKVQVQPRPQIIGALQGGGGSCGGCGACQKCQSLGITCSDMAIVVAGAAGCAATAEAVDAADAAEANSYFGDTGTGSCSNAGAAAAAAAADWGATGGAAAAVTEVDAALEEQWKLEALEAELDQRERAEARWSEADRQRFVDGVFAFRRNFARIRQLYLPHKSHKDIIAFFYKHWKLDPRYRSWKSMTLLGRRVLKPFAAPEGPPRLYLGVVSVYYSAAQTRDRTELFHVVYEDGDTEDLNRTEIEKLLLPQEDAAAMAPPLLRPEREPWLPPMPLPPRQQEL